MSRYSTRRSTSLNAAPSGPNGVLSSSLSSSKSSTSNLAKKPPVALAVVEKSDPMVLLFRREVSSFLLSSPTGQEATVVLAAIERISSAGIQESVQLCSNAAGDAKWVTRTEGKREFFPRVGRVKATKRVRDDDDAEEEEGKVDEEMEEERVDQDEAHGERFVTPKNRTAGQHKRSKGSRNPTAGATPGASSHTTRSVPSPVSRRRATVSGIGLGLPPNAPKLRTRVRSTPGLESLAEGEEFVPLRLGRTNQEEMRKRVTEALARGAGEGGHAGSVSEQDLDDLASLCGRVDGLDVKSSVADNDFDSDYEPSTTTATTSATTNASYVPVASTSKLASRSAKKSL